MQNFIKKLSLVLFCLFLGNIKAIAQDYNEEAVVIVDKKAEFPGGKNALLEYIDASFRYPKSALHYSVEGRVIVLFNISEEGKISVIGTTNVRIGYGLEEEAERIIAGMPDWEPAKKAGKAVKSIYRLPIVFGLHKDKAADTSTREVFRYVEQMPEFMGGNVALNAYLKNTIRYPDYAKENGLEAKVNVVFIVNEDGSIAATKVLKPVGNGFDKEAIRVINGMPLWKPGKQNGKPVRVYYNLPISFKLSK